MSNSLKISLIVLLVLAIISAIVVPIVLKWNSIKAAFTGAQTYTYEDVQNSYDKGYSDGAGDLENSSKLLEEFKNTLDENKAKLEEAQKEMQRLTEINNRLYDVENENTNLKDEISKLNNKISRYENQIEDLNRDINRLNQDLENQKTITKNKETEIEGYKHQVENFQASITELNVEISRLQELLKNSDIDFENAVFATFFVDDEIWKIKIYNKNDVLTIDEIPQKSFRTFKGWTLNGEDVIDLGSINITADMVLKAKFETSVEAFNFVGLDANGKVTTNEDDIVGYAIGNRAPVYTDSGMLSGSASLGFIATHKSDVTFCVESDLEVIEVPAEYKGKPVIAISNGAFNNLRGVKTIKLPDTIKGIASFAFHYSSVSNINLPNQLEKIGLWAFMESPVGSELVIPESVTYIGEGAFKHTDIKSLTINANITKLERETFAECFRLVKVVITSPTLETIGVSAFSKCYLLVTLQLNEGLVSIGGSAFYNCPRLIKVVLPSTTTQLGEKCFAGFRTVLDLYIKSTSHVVAPSVLCPALSEGLYQLWLYVPESELSKYQTKYNGWRVWAEEIRTIEEWLK